MARSSGTNSSAAAAAQKGQQQQQQQDDREELKKNNFALIKRIAQYKTEMELLKKVVKDLREENNELRQQREVWLTGSEDDRIELIVADRIKKKTAHIVTHSQIMLRTVNGSMDKFKELLAELEEVADLSSPPRASLLRSKNVLASRRVSQKPDLDKVVESPLLRTSARTSQTSADLDITLADDTELGEEEIEEEADIYEDETPKAPESQQKGRRSCLLVPIESNQLHNRNRVMFVSTSRGEKKGSSVSPVKFLNQKSSAETEKGSEDRDESAVKRAAKESQASPDNNAQSNDMEDFFTPQTTVRRPRTSRRDSGPDKDTDAEIATTIRHKRAASMKIASFAEPRLGTKLRRPDKLDAPSPYIHSQY